MQSDYTGRAKVMLLLGFAGMVGLIAVENARAVDFPEEMGMILPVMLSLASLPIVLLTLMSHATSRWIALIIAVLLTLFHVMHVIEHGLSGDWSLTLLIALAMLTPSAAAVWLLWKARSS